MQIPLSQNKFAVVDDADHERFGSLHWYYRGERNQALGYAARHVKINGKHRLSYLHREIMNPPPGTEVIFLNHDRLDCRRHNLQIVSHKEARRHHRPRRDSVSGIKGVTYHPETQKYTARLTRNGVYRHLGTFDTALAAIQAYQDADARYAQQQAQ